MIYLLRALICTQHISVARGGAYSAWASFVFLLVSGFAKTLESVKAKELHAFFVCLYITMNTLSNVEPHGGEEHPPGAGLTSCIIPDAVCARTGVSVRYVPAPDNCWFVFRASYGRQDKAEDFLINNGVYAYVPRRYERKTVNGKPVTSLNTLIPNLVFAYTTCSQAEFYGKDNPDLPYLSFYRDHFCIRDGKNPPLTISCREMENFILATYGHSEHLLRVKASQCHYKSGETVIITDGMFKGVYGKVARVAGQQRVVIALSDFGLFSTAYIPTAFLVKIHSQTI